MGAVEKRIEKLEHDRARSREGLFWALGIAYGAFFGWVIGRQKGAEAASREERALDDRRDHWRVQAEAQKAQAGVRVLARRAGMSATEFEDATREALLEMETER